MLQENLLKIYETSFRENREMSALTDYFKGETFSYYEMAKEIAKIHLLFKKAGIKQGDKIALIGRNNPRWCITYMGTITYGAVIVPILQDFTPADIIHIINHSESRLLFLGDNFWDVIEEDQIKQIEAVFSLTDFHAIYERDGKSLTKFQRDIVKNYRTKYPRGFSVNDIKYPEIPNDQVVLLNYTSGTTGYSKGVMLTVNNLTSNVMFAATTINTQTGQRYFQKGGRTLSFLPLAHADGQRREEEREPHEVFARGNHQLGRRAQQQQQRFVAMEQQGAEQRDQQGRYDQRLRDIDLGHAAFALCQVHRCHHRAAHAEHQPEPRAEREERGGEVDCRQCVAADAAAYEYPVGDDEHRREDHPHDRGEKKAAEEFADRRAFVIDTVA